ncbi:hypothetical protein GCM10008956_31730 [Deinococcus arenae]|uniref:Uncharacterized protein n=1 Tax=Deinococcus arenae TaxID=1452751 RepID=A0A8H9LCK3_9DEIO|nr:hypothetical protein [Deinococcus arenae]GGM53390.1 hypothetical protein GCM10008956_31730 [Deinococcus arenae]
MQETDESTSTLALSQQAITAVDATAWVVLASALQEGQAELDAADSNDVGNVTVSFFSRTGEFIARDRDGWHSLDHDCCPGDIVRCGLLATVAVGHGEVVVMVSVVPYLRAGMRLYPLL